MNETYPVQSTSPVAPYIGGKRVLAKTLVERINATRHDGYAEPFVGMGGVFFRRDRKPKTEVINDISGDVANLFRILQRHYPQFIETLRFQLTSRREFERLSASNPSTLTDLERAGRFLYLQRTAFGGKVAGRNFGVSKERPARFDLTRLAPMLEDVHERLAGVVIESLPWAEFITRYDRQGMLFYLDPPYWGCEDDYGKGAFDRSEFALLADLLAGIKGRFILSLNDRPEVRDTFARFDIRPVELSYSITSAGATNAREVIIEG